MSLHLELAEIIDEAFADRLRKPVGRTQDALILDLGEDMTLTVRYAAPDAYSLRWIRNGREAGIDTAPLHRDLASFPNHLHHASGKILADPVTRPDDRPEDNLRRLITTLLEHPEFGTEDA
ncbi:MAG: hypothetical protein KJZ96_04910 [Rhodocyclaceae bacterium]|jgi:hypothetical protein|nr:hypothetical protein [Rhodocyclaceae bacterium]MCL4757665.1 hypothetical protein [Rhodocyclaceae bacterium]